MNSVSPFALADIPHRISFVSSFIFLNDGTRAGAVKLDPPSFSPSREFAKFFEMFVVRVTDTTNNENIGNSYFVVKERESKIVNVEVEVVLSNWKKRFRYEKNGDTAITLEFIRETLRKASKSNYEHFEDFCLTLRGELLLGILSIGSKETKRKGVFGIELSEKNLDNLPSNIDLRFDTESVGVFDDYLEKWEQIAPTVIPDALTAIREAFHGMILQGHAIREIIGGDLQRQMYGERDRIGGFVVGPELSGPFTTEGWKGLFVRGALKEIADFLVQYNGLGPRLADIDLNIHKYSQALQACILSDVKPKPALAKTLTQQRDAIFADVQRAQDDLIGIRNVVGDCIKKQTKVA